VQQRTGSAATPWLCVFEIMNIPNKNYHQGYMFKYVTVGYSVFEMFVAFFAVMAYAKKQGLIIM
jgi:hypothetical protein